MRITADAAGTVTKAEAAGGKVIVAPLEVGDQGTMAFIADPSGAVTWVWQLKKMTGAQVMGRANSYGWAELNSRSVDKAIPLYKKVFGWGEKKSDMAEGMDYTQFLAGASASRAG